MQWRWQWSTFSDLAVGDLHVLLQARAQVFVVEQQCAYQDIDGHDPIAQHLLGWDATSKQPTLAAYARVLPQNIRFKEMCIGRVITTAAYRKQKLGHLLMSECITRAMNTFGQQPLRISAQSHLQAFYAQHGFVGQGDTYLEDGIVHRQMLRIATSGR